MAMASAVNIASEQCRPLGSSLLMSKLRESVDDEQLKALKSSFIHVGRGRPPKPPVVEFNNRLLLQLLLLKEDSKKTWEDVANLLSTLFPQSAFPSVQSIVETASKEFSEIGASDQAASFLDESRDSCVYPGFFCKKYGITRADLLLKTLCERQSLISCPVGVVEELYRFGRLQKLKDEVIFGWVTSLTGDVPAPDLKKKLEKVKKKTSLLRKNRSKTGGEDALQQFLESPFGNFESSATHTQSKRKGKQTASERHQLPSSEAGQVNRNPTSNDSTDTDSGWFLLKKATEELSVLRGKLSEKERELHIKEAELCGVKELLIVKKEEINGLMIEADKREKQLVACQRRLKSLRTRHEALRSALKERRQECVQLRKTNIYSRNLRLQRKLKEKEQQLANKREVETQLQEEKTKKRKYQVQSSQIQMKKRKLEDDLKTAQEVIRALQDEEVVTAPETRDERGQFKEDVVMCVMALLESEVPASRCSSVIQTVARQLFKTDLPNSALPSKTTSLRYADQAQAMAKMHVAEALSTQKFDLHTDGTSRNNKKYVGFQVTLENKKTLSLGFDPVAQETAQTLLDLALNKLTELSILYSPEDSETQLKTILRNMVGVMSDRAAKMKQFGRQLENYREETLEAPDEHIRLEFLHCNAHFLLGLSTAAEKALQQVAEATGLKGKLGRDTIAAFQFYKSQETAACRYIRMACDTLGPRGDERNGCHQLWLMYCQNLLERQSAITSFRGNRFNNLFCAAAGLIHHRDDIIQFFNRRHPSNLKQKSVEADATCEDLNVMVLGLAVLYIYITGPFWTLINSDIHYLEQYRFIQPMHSHLKELADHPDLLLNDVPDELEALRLRNSPVVVSVLNHAASIAEERRPLLLAVFKALAEQFLIVVERQLADFLADGKYGSEPTEEARERMKHCQLTNLLGEACFADLDYSMHKNRGAALHFHTTTNMAKRNKPISGWLSKKTAQQKTTLIARSRKLGPEMREAGKRQQLLVLAELQENMEATEAEERRKAEKKLQAKQKLADEVAAQGGPCRSRHDVEVLVEKYSTLTSKVNAVKLQIRYLKVFFEVKDDRLQLSNISLDGLCHNLSSYLEERFPTCASASPGDDIQLDILDEAPEEEETEEYEDPLFHFTTQGQTVAVFYKNDEQDEIFYIGQVLETYGSDEAAVSFMEQRGTRNSFKWPGSDAIERVNNKYVFFWDFNIIPQNRTWSVQSEDWAMLRKKWRQYVNTFC